jgi:predicted transcriptional regulator
MARPKTPHPTAAELEVLQILWDRGPSTVREVLEVLPKERAYTSVMSLLNVMFEKGQVSRKPEGRAFRYSAKHQPRHHESTIVGDLLERVFSGSASALVARLLEQAQPSDEELTEIHRLISEHKRRKTPPS